MKKMKGKIIIEILLVIIGVSIVGGISYAGYQYYQKNSKSVSQLTSNNLNKTNEAIQNSENSNRKNNAKVVDDRADNTQFLNCPAMKNYDDVENDENPDEVAELLYKASTQNDYDYMLPHLHCDENCQKTIFDVLGLCFNEYVELNKWGSEQEKEVEFLELSTTPIDKTDSTAKYQISYKITYIEPNGEIRGGYQGGNYEMELMKVGKRWKMDLSANSEARLALSQQLQAVYNDIQKCINLPPLMYTVPTSNGYFEVNDSSHPLYGFAIDFPNLREPLEISVSCLEKFPQIPSSLQITLPISINYDQDIAQLISEQDELTASNIYQNQFHYTLPYYDIGFNDESGYAGAIGAEQVNASSSEIDVFYPTKIIDTQNNLLAVDSFSLHPIIFGISMFDKDLKIR